MIAKERLIACLCVAIRRARDADVPMHHLSRGRRLTSHYALPAQLLSGK